MAEKEEIKKEETSLPPVEVTPPSPRLTKKQIIIEGLKQGRTSPEELKKLAQEAKCALTFVYAVKREFEAGKPTLVKEAKPPKVVVEHEEVKPPKKPVKLPPPPKPVKEEELQKLEEELEEEEPEIFEEIDIEDGTILQGNIVAGFFDPLARFIGKVPDSIPPPAFLEEEKEMRPAGKWLAKLIQRLKLKGLYIELLFYCANTGFTLRKLIWYYKHEMEKLKK
ncbi:MAG: hypothetical protein KIH08_16830 [Candidatus Freyarchaeota archaeon]|nr:hypothetical protein [Candidatus Jordarchaeia archaeon]